jgi:hypothetical protein
MLPELHSILNLLEGGFSRLNIFVIGDIMLDRYIHGEVERISPEAPVPVIRHAQRYERAGGAANVAMNLAGLGCRALLAGYWGDDTERGELAAILDRAGVDTSGVVVCRRSRRRASWGGCSSSFGLILRASRMCRERRRSVCANAPLGWWAGLMLLFCLTMPRER